MVDVLYIVIPCYNEEAVLPLTSRKLGDKLYSLIVSDLISVESRILFVDDGSTDKTWQIIENLCKEESIFSGLKLSHNKGHQNALLAGLFTAKQYADAVISMDADLQDDVDVVDKFISEYYKGSEIVYGIRSSRKKDTAFKRITAEGFYKFMHLMGVEMIFNHADYRLMSKEAIECLEQFKEVNLFLRGIVPLIGLKSTAVLYERGERAAGVSKYPVKKMLEFAFEGITSFSVKPIRFITSAGLIITLASIISFILSMIINSSAHTSTELICSIWFVGGIQLLSVGLIGEYIGKIYAEVKNRPRYLIEKSLNLSKNKLKDSGKAS